MNIFKNPASKELDAANRELQQASARATDVNSRLTAVDQSIKRTKENIAQKNAKLTELARGSLSPEEVEVQSRLTIEERIKEEAWLVQSVKNRDCLLNDLAAARAAAIACERALIAVQATVASSAYQKALDGFVTHCDEPFRKLRAVAYRHFFYVYAQSMSESAARQTAWQYTNDLWSELDNVITRIIESEPEDISTEIGTAELIRAESVSNEERAAIVGKPAGAAAAAIRQLISDGLAARDAVPAPPSLSALVALGKKCDALNSDINDLEGRMSVLRLEEKNLKNAPMPTRGSFNEDRSFKKVKVLNEIKEVEEKIDERRKQYAETRASLELARASRETKAA